MLDIIPKADWVPFPKCVQTLGPGTACWVDVAKPQDAQVLADSHTFCLVTQSKPG